MGLRSWILESQKDNTDTPGTVRRRIVYRIYSETLECYLYVVETDQDLHSLRSQGKTDPTYTAEEIQKLRGICKDSLREIHKIKEVFQDSKIEEILPKKGDSKE